VGSAIADVGTTFFNEGVDSSLLATARYAYGNLNFRQEEVKHVNNSWNEHRVVSASDLVGQECSVEGACLPNISPWTEFRDSGTFVHEPCNAVTGLYPYLIGPLPLQARTDVTLLRGIQGFAWGTFYAHAEGFFTEMATKLDQWGMAVLFHVYFEKLVDKSTDDQTLRDHLKGRYSDIPSIPAAEASATFDSIMNAKEDWVYDLENNERHQTMARVPGLTTSAIKVVLLILRMVLHEKFPFDDVLFERSADILVGAMSESLKDYGGENAVGQIAEFKRVASKESANMKVYRVPTDGIQDLVEILGRFSACMFWQERDGPDIDTPSIRPDAHCALQPHSAWHRKANSVNSYIIDLLWDGIDDKISNEKPNLELLDMIRDIKTFDDMFEPLKAWSNLTMCPGSFALDVLSDVARHLNIPDDEWLSSPKPPPPPTPLPSPTPPPTCGGNNDCCGGDNDCKPNGFCSANGYCKPKKAKKKWCTRKSECLSNKCKFLKCK